MVWAWPDAGGDALLGAVAVSEAKRWDLFYGLVRAAAAEARALGFGRGSFRVQDGRLLDRLQRDFSIEPWAAGWDPATGEPVEWVVEVDLTDALAQLDRALGKLASPRSGTV